MYSKSNRQTDVIQSHFSNLISVYNYWSSIFLTDLCWTSILLEAAVFFILHSAIGVACTFQGKWDFAVNTYKLFTMKKKMQSMLSYTQASNLHYRNFSITHLKMSLKNNMYRVFYGICFIRTTLLLLNFLNSS